MKKITVEFQDSNQADSFREEMKKRFNYPETTSRHQVVHGTDENGKTVFVNKREVNMKGKNINKLFSRIEGETWTDNKGKTWMYHEGTPDQELDYDVNANLPDRATFRAYKMFNTKYNPDNPKTYQYKGLLFPLYINAKNGYQIGKWYKAGKGSFRILCDENGEPILDSSGNPTCRCTDTDLAYRPGLHMGSLPVMRHRGRSDYPHIKGVDYDYFHSQEVFAEVEYAGNYDYTEKSQQRRMNSANPDNPYEAGFYDTTDFENGYYKFKTNINATDEEAWFIADAMKIIRVLTDEEVERIIAESGSDIKAQIRGEPNGKDGDMFMADFTQFNIQSSFKRKPIKSRRLNGETVDRKIQTSDINSAVYDSGLWFDVDSWGTYNKRGFLCGKEKDEYGDYIRVGEINWDSLGILTKLKSGEEWLSTSIEEFKKDLEDIKSVLDTNNKLLNSSLNLTDVFYDLIDEGYIYEEDEKGYNMSYGEYAAISDYMWEKVEEELEQYYDFESAYDAFQDIVNSADDDTKMFWDYSDEDDDFYFYADYDNGTYSVSGECPAVLKDRFEEFQQNTDLERV